MRERGRGEDRKVRHRPHPFANSWIRPFACIYSKYRSHFSYYLSPSRHTHAQFLDRRRPSSQTSSCARLIKATLSLSQRFSAVGRSVSRRSVHGSVGRATQHRTLRRHPSATRHPHENIEISKSAARNMKPDSVLESRTQASRPRPSLRTRPSRPRSRPRTQPSRPRPRPRTSLTRQREQD